MNIKIISVLAAIFTSVLVSKAQVNQVTFGKNRVQHNKFNWEFYQTENFNVFYYQNGKELAKQVAQMAEIELPQIERFTEYSLQRRANIVLYNTYDHYKQTNIGLNTDWTTSGGTTKLVNNKCMVYFANDHGALKSQVRTGIAKILTENMMFGSNLGEIARNQTLLDLPPWMIEGYYNYVGEDWNTKYDDDLRNEFLVNSYKNYYRFAYKKPELAGRAFWHYMDMKYKKENTTYFLYLARVFKSLNTASLKISGLKFKPLLKQIMTEMYERYDSDIDNRRSYVKGDNNISENVSDKKDFIRFAAHPAKNNDIYAVVQFTKGKYKVRFYDDYGKGKTLLSYGTRTLKGDIHPSMPLLSWDTKGEYLSCIYYEQGQIKLFVFDMVKGYKTTKRVLKEFDQVQSLNYMPQENLLLLSGVRNGQSDVYTYNIDTEEYSQITNDIYADLDATFVTFPNKTGIIYSSNRGRGSASADADTVLPANNKFNIYLVDNWNKSEFKQISQLTNIKNGEARLPTQYNQNHFTFVCDENGIANRWAGFFKTEKAGLDTVVKIGNVILRNPSNRELDSVLVLAGKSEPDSLYEFAITNDSSYVFPLTDYETNIRESKVSGNSDQVSEVNLEGKTKNLYKMRVDELTLRRRNVNPRNTTYRTYKNDLDKKATYTGELNSNNDAPKNNDVFQTEFDKDTSNISLGTIVGGQTINNNKDILNKSKNYPYRLKFSVDKIATNAFSNEVIFNQFQPYNDGAGPISLSNGGGFNGLFKASVYDVLEDYRITAAIRAPTGSDIGNVAGASTGFNGSAAGLLSGNSEMVIKAEYLKRRIDYTATYYRSAQVGSFKILGGGNLPAKQLTNVYAGMVKYPFDEVKSLRFHAALRIDQITLKAGGIPDPIWPSILPTVDSRTKFGLFKIEYIYDNSIEKAENIWNGLRYKAYLDLNTQLGKERDFDGVSTPVSGKNIFNAGFDARYYHPIVRNFIWATRVSGDFSWGEQKTIYYIGGVDGWIRPIWNNNPPVANVNYTFQTLAPNLRGFNQNVSNGNNNLVINTELRCPIIPTIFDRPINNAFLRNFQLVTFIDLATAWTGSTANITRPSTIYNDGIGPGPFPATASVLIKPGGIGPFIGGYGYGVRGKVLGYFARLDLGYDMNRFFKKPKVHFALGLDF